MSVGSMSPAAAASTAPLRATSVIGQTTAVVMAGQMLAALDELVKDVIVGGMPDKWINGNGFSQGGKIAHELNLLSRQVPMHRGSQCADFSTPFIVA